MKTLLGKDTKRSFRTLVLFYSVGLLAALGLKTIYSRGGSEDLKWILLPTTRLVEALSGLTFEYEKHAGFVNRAEGIIIAPSCAGINYMIIVFCSFYFSFLPRFKASGAKLAWLGCSLGLAYLVTLGANAGRIMLSILLFEADIYGGWVTPERVHRIEGTVIYFLFLLVVYLLMERGVEYWKPSKGVRRLWLDARHQALISLCLAFLVPFFWYGVITIVLPLLNGAARVEGAKFLEHSLLVFSLSLGVLVTLFSILLLCSGWGSKKAGVKQG
jgi:exosortase K